MKKNEVGIIWDESTLNEWKEYAEDLAWRHFKEGQINGIDYTKRIADIRKWVKNKVEGLNN